MKKLLLTILACVGMAASVEAGDGFAIVIDKDSYGEARAEVDAYAQCVEQLHGLKVFTVVDRWGVPDSIRAELIRLHTQKTNPIVGTVLIGDIPVAMIRDGQHMTSAFKMNQVQPRKESSIPSDRFYDDFGLRFRYLDRDSDANYFYYSVTPESDQRLHPDIYSGRIRPTDANGTSRYGKLRQYLRKLVAVKQQQRRLEKMFFFSGHGYISESKVARMDEKAAWFEHFPQLKDNRNRISYMDHSDHNPVKEQVMGEVMRTDLDLAVLHHHGYWDTEYFNGSKQIVTVKQAKEYIRQNVREHIVAAKQKGRDWEKMQRDLQERFDLPDSWLADVFDPALSLNDSIEDAAADLHLEDFAFYGYQPNAPVVVIDACFCGSFHREDCIANEYIFQPGTTVSVVANSVNVLQDKWSDRLIGLIAEGGCVGDIVRYSTYLESHVVGDPTYRFTPKGNAPDIDHLILENKPATWKKLLKSEKPELQSLAIEQLCRLGRMTSAQLRQIYETSPVGIVRLMALMKIADCRDDNAIEVIKLASQDSYEMVQRQAIRLIHNSGDERLIPALIAISIENNTSDRVNFDARMALGVFPEDKLQREFALQFDRPTVQTIHKDTIRSLISKTITRYASSKAKEIEAIDTASVKEVKFTIRSQRNDLVHAYVPFFLNYVESGKAEPEVQTMVLEALGWHPQSYMAPVIAEHALAISKDEKYAREVRDEALKTYNRIHAR
ncbi:MAG: HEAT repeat domain-containing protein [Bacteroidaceae bacterium]|nr:HEAT repeat domain-containing protein [Bacteroidaceae bacterium]